MAPEHFRSGLILHGMAPEHFRSGAQLERMAWRRNSSARELSLKADNFRPPHKVVVRRSRGKGRGVFAVGRIRAGELIERAPVLVVPAAERAALAAGFLGHYMFQTDDESQYVVALGLTSMINHDAAANAEFTVTADAITIKARRSIAPGTEITIDYGWWPEEWAKLGIEMPPGTPA